MQDGQVLVIERTNGSITVSAFPDDKPTKEAVELTLTHFDERFPGERVNTIWVNREDTPTDRYFRNAWAAGIDAINIDMPKAREIHLDSIRAARAEKFDELGFPVKLSPDLEAAVIPEEVREQLQELRDIPQTLDLSVAETPEALKAIWPEQLEGFKNV